MLSDSRRELAGTFVRSMACDIGASTVAAVSYRRTSFCGGY
jgi:hypothetical protein